MKFLQSFIPLNIFHIQANSCCDVMFSEYYHNNFNKYFLCYDACSIFESNMLIIWGSLSYKLINNTNHMIKYMPKQHFILHIKGCNKRLNHRLLISSLESFLPIDLVVSDCHLQPTTIKKIIIEARQCLKA